jgi:predicted RNA-binding protein YlxR (DUF448 family)
MPVRTCVACRRSAESSGLLRFVVREGSLTADPGHKLPGRGAYICPTKQCVELAFMKKGLFARALRTMVEMPDMECILSMTEDVLDG